MDGLLYPRGAAFCQPISLLHNKKGKGKSHMSSRWITCPQWLSCRLFNFVEKGRTRSIQNRVKIVWAVFPVFSDLARKKSPRRRPMHSLPLPFSLWGGIHSAKQAKRSLPPPLAPTLSSDEGGPGGGGRGRLGNQDLQPRRCIYSGKGAQDFPI